MDVVYILSPARSGSTILQFLLSDHPKIIGLGEVRNVLREYRRRDIPIKSRGHCSCGKVPELCLFWGSVLQDLLIMPESDAFHRSISQFELLLRDRIMIDSSKSGVFLDEFYCAHLQSDQDPTINLKVLYLVRDFRGWLTSVRRHRARVSRSSRWLTNIVVSSYRWLYTSIKWLHKVRKHCLEVLPVYYEHLVFDTDNQLRRVFDFLGLDNIVVTVSSEKEVHEMYGSAPLRRDPRKSSRIIYDSKWMQNFGVIIWGPMLIPPAIFNSFYARKSSANRENG